MNSIITQSLNSIHAFYCCGLGVLFCDCLRLMECMHSLNNLVYDTLFLYLQVKEALAVTRGDLDEAERIAAEDRVAISGVDEDTEEATPVCKKQKKAIEDPVLVEMRKKFADAQATLTTVNNALTKAEPVTERTAFMDWVRQVCKNVSDDQFTEFQTAFIQMQTRWKMNDKQQQMSQMSSCTSSSSHTGPSPTPESGIWQPMPSQWRMPPPHQDASPRQSQSCEYMQAYMQQPVNPTTCQSQQCSTALPSKPPGRISAAMPVPRPSSAPAASTAGVCQAFSSALLNIHDEQQENVTDYDI